MANPKVSPELFQHRWLHSYEEDTASGQFYRPESWDFPLSRRPREALELRADGAVRLLLPGEEDRPRAEDASWIEEGGAIVVRTAKKGSRGGSTLRIVESGADKLVIRRE